MNINEELFVRRTRELEIFYRARKMYVEDE